MCLQFPEGNCKRSQKTGHGYCDDDPELSGPSETDIAMRDIRGVYCNKIHVLCLFIFLFLRIIGQFRSQRELTEYITLLHDLATCLSAKEAMTERSKQKKPQDAAKQKKLLQAGKFVQAQAKRKLQSSPATSAGTSPANGKTKRLIDLVRFFATLCVCFFIDLLCFFLFAGHAIVG